MPLVPLLFTPHAALIGGATLGVAAIAKYSLTGRILGISGTVKGFVTGDASHWRSAFAGGLVAAGGLALKLMPGAFDTLPASYTVSAGGVHGVQGWPCWNWHINPGNPQLECPARAICSVG
jgi:hypothetical protein